MQNQINQQCLPPQGYNQCYMTQPQTANCQPVQPYVNPGYVTQAYPAGPTAAGVNIQIYNPTANANPQGFYQPIPCAPYPCNYNNCMNQQAQYQYPNPSDAYQQQMNQNMTQTMNLNAQNNGIAGQGQGAEGAKTEEKKEVKKPKVALTDDYIRTLENYLNSQDKKIRLMGARELFERFKEDENRKDDAALTALLNKTLQDPAETVKFIGLTALDAGYATGNNETAQLLNQMQASNGCYGEDAMLASRILLKMSGYKANADAAALQNQGGANLATQNPQGMVEPNLVNQNQMSAIDTKMPPRDGTLMTPNQNASMSQSMQIGADGTTSMNQSMVPPLNRQ